MQWLFNIVIEMMENAGFIRIGDVEAYLKGMIVMWSGTEANIPDGWALCDGTQGTPDLKIRFVLGSFGLGTVGFTGGDINHTHTFTADGHLHEIPSGDSIAGGDNFSDRTLTSIAVGTTDNNSDAPPFYVLAFIMKL